MTSLVPPAASGAGGASDVGASTTGSSTGGCASVSSPACHASSSSDLRCGLRLLRGGGGVVGGRDLRLHDGGRARQAKVATSPASAIVAVSSIPAAAATPGRRWQPARWRDSQRSGSERRDSVRAPALPAARRLPRSAELGCAPGVVTSPVRPAPPAGAVAGACVLPLPPAAGVGAGVTVAEPGGGFACRVVGRRAGCGEGVDGLIVPEPSNNGGALAEGGGVVSTEAVGGPAGEALGSVPVPDEPEPSAALAASAAAAVLATTMTSTLRLLLPIGTTWKKPGMSLSTTRVVMSSSPTLKTTSACRRRCSSTPSVAARTARSVCSEGDRSCVWTCSSRRRTVPGSEPRQAAATRDGGGVGNSIASCRSPERASARRATGCNAASTSTPTAMIPTHQAKAPAPTGCGNSLLQATPTAIASTVGPPCATRLVTAASRGRGVQAQSWPFGPKVFSSIPSPASLGERRMCFPHPRPAGAVVRPPSPRVAPPVLLPAPRRCSRGFPRACGSARPRGSRRCRQ